VSIAGRFPANAVTGSGCGVRSSQMPPSAVAAIRYLASSSGRAPPRTAQYPSARGYEGDMQQRAGIYDRVSDDQQGRSRSVEQQHHDNEQAATESGWQVVARYQDPGISASRFARPCSMMHGVAGFAHWSCGP
jgi:hypothetical protein